MNPLISPEWLTEHLADVRVVDVRWYLNPRPDGLSAREAYLRGHLPGAVWLDVDTDLSAPATPEDGRHPLPSPATFAAALGRVGIAEGTPIVAYDDDGGSKAARLWWLLHVLGEPAAVLDGGIAAWPGPLEVDEPSFTPVPRPERPWPASRFASADDLLGDGRTIYDARTAERYAHGDPSIDPRPGHVPGARSMPWGSNLRPDGRFRPPEELRSLYAEASGRGAIAYCGSGVTACHDLLAMHLAGIESIALYAGSWSQWGADASRPTEMAG